MDQSLSLPDFIVVENDPLVLMDIRNMLMREFNVLPLSLETPADLGDLLAVVGCPAVIIAACDLDVLRDQLAGSAASFSVVMIADKPKTVVELPFGLVFVPPPFSADLLLKSVRSACAHLHSIL